MWSDCLLDLGTEIQQAIGLPVYVVCNYSFVVFLVIRDVCRVLLTAFVCRVCHSDSVTIHGLPHCLLKKLERK